MANANFVKAAQKDIYEKGKYVKYTSKKGKREGQELSKLDRTVPADENDKIFIAKGESYYWWQFKNGPKNISKERPKQSQLTQSNYLGQLYSIMEQIDDIECNDPSELEGIADGIKCDIESLKEETEGSLENMPESLQSSPTGELLQERIDTLDNAISEFESIDFEYEEPTIEEWINDESLEDADEEANEWQEENPDFISWKEEKAQSFIEEKLDEIRNISLE